MIERAGTFRSLSGANRRFASAGQMRSRRPQWRLATPEARPQPRRIDGVAGDFSGANLWFAIKSSYLRLGGLDLGEEMSYGGRIRSSEGVRLGVELWKIPPRISPMSVQKSISFHSQIGISIPLLPFSDQFWWILTDFLWWFLVGKNANRQDPAYFHFWEVILYKWRGRRLDKTITPDRLPTYLLT